MDITSVQDSHKHLMYFVDRHVWDNCEQLSVVIVILVNSVFIKVQEIK